MARAGASACRYFHTDNLNSTLDNPPVNYDERLSCDAGYVPATFFDDATLLRCDLVNTTYSVQFNYVSGAQNTTILTDMNKTSSPITTFQDFVGPQSPDTYQNASSRPANCSVLYEQPRTDNYAYCDFDASAVRLLAYQAISSAFNQIVLGLIGWGGNGQVGKTYEPVLNLNSTIMRTVLAETQELAFLQNSSYDSQEDPDMQTVMMNSQSAWAYPGLVSPLASGTRGSLKSALEMLFQNITISLLSVPYLQ